MRFFDVARLRQNLPLQKPVRVDHVGTFIERQRGERAADSRVRSGVMRHDLASQTVMPLPRRVGGRPLDQRGRAGRQHPYAARAVTAPYCAPYRAPYGDGPPAAPAPVPGCATCTALAAQREDARAEFDRSGETDANVLLRRHQRLRHPEADCQRAVGESAHGRCY